MYKLISQTIVNRWVKEMIISEDDSDIYAYGIEIILSSIIGALLVLAFGCIFFSPIYPIIFLSVMIPIRCYCGGYHANTYITCNTVMVISFLVTAFISKHFSIGTLAFAILIICCNLIIAIMSPIDNKHKRLTKDEKKKCKTVSIVLSLSITLIDIIMLILQYSYYNLILFTLVLVAILMILGKIKNRGC